MKGKWSPFDSCDEVAFNAWCVEAQKIGLISRFEYHLKSYELIPEIPCIDENEKKKKFHSRNYTPDFWIWPAWENIRTAVVIPGLILTGPKEKKKKYSASDFYFCIDVKPGHQVQSARTQLFRYQQSLMLEKFNIHVNELKIEDFFKKTFIPAFCRLKNGSLPVRFAGCMSSENYKKKMEAPEKWVLELALELESRK
jgi:hypothetical protein